MQWIGGLAGIRRRMSLRHRVDEGRTTWILALTVAGALALESGCIVSSESLGGSPEGSSDHSGNTTSAGGTSDSGVGGSNSGSGVLDGGLSDSDSGLDGSDGGSTSGTGQGQQAGSGGDDAPPDTAVCESIEHASCHAAMVAACDPLVAASPDCVVTTDACYPFGPSVLSRPTVYQLCSAELEETCVDNTSFSCGQSYCECVAGLWPYHWDNCFQTVSAACVYSQDGDCEGALQACFPGSTRTEFEVCASKLDVDCNCPKCGRHEQCQEEVTACLQG